jgi:hypothetical protein
MPTSRQSLTQDLRSQPGGCMKNNEEQDPESPPVDEPAGRQTSEEPEPAEVAEAEEQEFFVQKCGGFRVIFSAATREPLGPSMQLALNADVILKMMQKSQQLLVEAKKARLKQQAEERAEKRANGLTFRGIRALGRFLADV